MSKKIFSGVQPTGNLHLGNYLGAVKRFVELQDKNAEWIYCLVDLHAITNWQDPRELKKNTLEVTATFLACGLKENRSIIFRFVPETGLEPVRTNVHWILSPTCLPIPPPGQTYY